MCSWLVKYRWDSAFLTGISRNVCIDTFRPYQLCKHQYGWCEAKTFPEQKDELSSGTAIIPFTMHTQGSATSTFLLGFMEQPEGESEATMWQQ